MSPAQNNPDNWQPTASLFALTERAKLYHTIRDFFYARAVLEVETPLLDKHGVSDVFLQNITVEHRGQTYYLQTSPEYAMKRLLASGIGSIYQICKSFRQDESGQVHQPEFTLLEWYRVGFSHHDLMDEVDLLLQTTLKTNTAIRISYEQLFLQHCELNPHTATHADCLAALSHHQIQLSNKAMTITKEDALHLLMSHRIEPTLGFKAPVFVYDYPETQAALAKIEKNRALRFEVYINGIELANGFYELTDAKVQRQRFEADNQHRKTLNLPQASLDTRLLAALDHGLPSCSGVALGLDRLLMIKLKYKDIAQVIAFANTLT